MSDGERRDRDLVAFRNFLGLRNNVPEYRFGHEDLSVARNVDVTDALSIRRRRGQSAPLVGGDCHSLWSDGNRCFAVQNNDLIEIFPDMSTKTLRPGLTPGLRVSFTSVPGRYFWSNGRENGCVDGPRARSWGLPVPRPPAVAAVGGTLHPGIYRFAVTAVRADGQESGAARSTAIALDTTGGVRVTLSETDDPDVVGYALYASKRNGEQLYRAGTVPVGTGTIDYTSEPAGFGPALATQFLSPPPAGQIVAEYRGYILVAAGPRLYVSGPYLPELFDLRAGQTFESEITMVAPMPDGVFVGTATRLVWLAGADPAAWVLSTRLQAAVVPGSLAYTDTGNIGDAASSLPVAVFMTADGVCAGTPGGAVQNLTKARFDLPVQDVAAAVVRSSLGTRQYIVALRGEERSPIGL